jgi:uncharacterized membrane protein
MKYELRYIVKYVLEYDAGIPKTIIFAVVLSICGVVVGLHLLRDEKLTLARNTSWGFFWGYVAFVLCYTVIFRSSRVTQIYFLRPLWGHTMLYYKMIAEMIMNVLLFIPTGFFVGASMQYPSFLKTIGYGLALSVTIELVQLASRRGVCNIDDVIHNALGCAIGYLLIRSCYLNVCMLRWCIRKNVFSPDFV